MFLRLAEYLDISMPSGGAHPRYYAHIWSLLELHLEADVRSRDIARFIRVSESFVSQIRSNFNVFNTVTPPPIRGIEKAASNQLQGEEEYTRLLREV